MMHTPGPWQVFTKTALDNYYIEKTVYWVGAKVPMFKIGEGEDSKANAYLIASAPELLDLVVCFVFGDVSKYPSDSEALAHARTLLKQVADYV